MCSPFPPFPCSCPLNMSDVLERGITSGAEVKPAHFPLPSVYTSHLVTPSPIHSSILACNFAPLSLFPFLSLHLTFSLIVFKHHYTYILCPLRAVQLYFFQLYLVECSSGCNISKLRTLQQKFKVRSSANHPQEWMPVNQYT